MIWTMTQKPNQKQEIARQQLNLRSAWASRECNWTSRNIKPRNSIRKKSYQISVWRIENSENINCESKMLFVPILFHHLACVCVLHCSCFMLLHHLITTPSLLYSKTKVHPIHFMILFKDIHSWANIETYAYKPNFANIKVFSCVHSLNWLNSIKTWTCTIKPYFCWTFSLTDWRHIFRKKTIEISSIDWMVLFFNRLHSSI